MHSEPIGVESRDLRSLRHPTVLGGSGRVDGASLPARGQVMFQGTEGIVPVDAVIERSEVGGQTACSVIGRDVSGEVGLRAELTTASMSANVLSCT